MKLAKLKEKSESIPTFITVERTLNLPIWNINLVGEIDNSSLKSKILEYKRDFPQSNVSNLITWNSSYYTHHNTDIFNEYLDIITNKITITLNNYYGEKHGHYAIDEFWCAIYEKNSYTKQHRHGTYPFSFCYYVEADPGSSPIVFENKYPIVPKSSMLILFSGSLAHHVPIMESESLRTILSGNILKLPRKKVNK